MKKILAFIMLLGIFCIGVPFSAAADAKELDLQQAMASFQEKNDAIEMTFDSSTGTLKVSGYGAVKGFSPRDGDGSYDMVYGFYTWGLYKETTVRRLEIEEGITSISNSFNDFQELEKISLPKTLRKIDMSFIACNKLKKVTIPSSVKSIGSAAFDECKSLKRIRFKGAVNVGESHTDTAFNSLSSLKYLYIPKGSVVDGSSFSYCPELRIVFFAGAADYHEGTDFHGAFYECPKAFIWSMAHVRIFGLVGFVILIGILNLILTYRKKKNKDG